jgi:hypothetical protein
MTLRKLFGGVVFFACCVAAAASLPSAGARTAPHKQALSAVARENLLPGAPNWQRHLHLVVHGAGAYIEGYASQVSVVPGQTVQFHVSMNPAGRYRILVYRMGWYHGAGARLHACLPSCKGSELGFPQPVPEPRAGSGLIQAGWAVTDRLTLSGGSWVSGYYIAKLVRLAPHKPPYASTIPFIVRRPTGHPAKILVQASANTWQAYNTWGGKSLYDGDPAAVKVSFGRPQGMGQTPFDFEYDLVRFLERRGFDVSYQADVDTDRKPGRLLHHPLVIVAGHSEYWTKRMRDAFDAARAGGVNLIFTSANTAYWQIRYQNHRRTIVEYRYANRDPESDPALKTIKFRALGRPECELLGIQFHNGNLMHINLGLPYSVTAAAEKNRFASNTGLTPGVSLPDLVGSEWDEITPGCDVPGKPTRILHYANGKNGADAVTYKASSGAHVFSAGSMVFDLGLNAWRYKRTIPQASKPLQRFMANMIAAWS